MKRHLALLSSAALVVAAVTMVVVPAGATTTGCRVDYTVSSQWQGGFTAAVAITNLGAPVTGWVLGFDFTAGQQVTQGWNATWSQSGAHVSAASLSWNGALGTGASTSIGFNATWSGTNPVPAAFTLNDVVCTGAVTTMSPSPSLSPSPSASASPSVSPSASTGDLPPVVKLTSPNSTTIYGEPGTIPLAAEASDPDGTITKVEFYTAPSSGTPFTLVATDVTAPYSVVLTVSTVSVFVVQVKAYDNAGMTATDTVRIRVAVSDPPPPSRSPNPA